MKNVDKRKFCKDHILELEITDFHERCLNNKQQASFIKNTH